MPGRKILVPSFDFKPLLGGVAHYVHELLTVLRNEHDCDIYILARQLPEASTYDQTSPFKITRVSTPSTAVFALPQWIWHIQKMQKAINPDLIFCPLWFPDASATFLAQKFSKHKVPYFIAAHAMEILDSNKNLKLQVRKKALSALKKSTFLNCEKVFPVSHYTSDLLLQNLGLSKTKIQVANNGINLDVYKSTSPQQDRFTKSKKTLLTVSRLLPFKGIDRVIQSLPFLLSQGLDVEYKVIGKGNDLPRLRELVKTLNLEKIVTFLGVQTQQQIIHHYNQSDLFVLLSREELPDVEGFGLVFLEAAACGLPSVGGRSGGIPDAVDHERSGWLVNPKDQSAINQQILELLKNPQKITVASKYCLEMVKKRTWSNTGHVIAEHLHVV